jgi:hypothetical protein
MLFVSCTYKGLTPVLAVADDRNVYICDVGLNTSEVSFEVVFNLL